MRSRRRSSVRRVRREQSASRRARGRLGIVLLILLICLLLARGLRYGPHLLRVLHHAAGAGQH